MCSNCSCFIVKWGSVETIGTQGKRKVWIMNYMELITPCHFGMESVMKKEITNLGYEIKEVTDGRVTFLGDAEAICRGNIFFRTTERLLLKVGEFKAESFDELFEGIKALPWENYIPKNGRFWVAKATGIKSKLFSSSDIQKIVKKAVVERLKQIYNIERFPEDGNDYPLRVSILKDIVTVSLDTSGDSLHKRGYRLLSGKAPITETLAAALIMLTPWNKDRILVDPFCGSGTIPIEAAMIGAKIAPGLNRDFTAMEWDNLINRKLWYEAVDEANELAEPREALHMDIQGYDIDSSVLKSARENSRLAGTEGLIHFQQRPVKDFSHPKKYGFIITNPPYGERMEEKSELPQLYAQMGEAFFKQDTWSSYIITAYEDAERYLGKKASKNRKIYNGMMKTYLYQYIGKKPPKKGHTVS